MVLFSKQLGGILGLMLLFVSVRAQYSSALMRSVLKSDISQVQSKDSLAFSMFTYQKKGARFIEIFDSLQKTKGYTFLEIDLRNYPKKADCSLRNASIEDCIRFIETNYDIDCNRSGTLFTFFLRSAKGNTDLGTIPGSMYQMMPAVIKYNDGYQDIEKKNAPGAYLKPDSPTYRPNIAAHDLPEYINGTIYQGVISTPDQFGYSFSPVRGTNTLNGNNKPQFVFDGFSFNHDLRLLNPNDLNVPTILLDAAAGAVQGSDASNSVFVTTPKKFDSKGFSVNFINGTTWHFGKNLDYQGPLSADSLLELRRLGVEHGPFNNISTETLADILWTNIKDPNSNKDSAQSILSQLSKKNLTKQIKEADYQHRIDNITHLSVGFGKNAFRFYGSLGYNIARMPEKGNEWQRATSMLNGSYNRNKLYIELTACGTLIKEFRNYISVPVRESYLSLLDADGSEAAFPFKYPYSFTSTTEGDAFKYRPLEESRLAHNQIDQRFYLLNSKIGYAITRHVQASMAAQCSYSDYDYQRIHDPQSFFTRDLVHQFKQADGNGGYTYPIPQAAIADRNFTATRNYGFRPQIDAKFSVNDFSINSFIAGEVKSYSMKATAGRRYGYGLDAPVHINLDTLYTSFLDPNKKESIPNPLDNMDSVNNFQSLLGSVMATYKDKFTGSFKIRRDQSNRFSSEVNRKGIYLWSVGAAWHVSRQDFLKDNKTITDLSLRGGYGANGNIDFSMPPIQTIRSATQTGVYTIDYPKTPNLGSEKLYILDFGIDFQLGQWLKGQVDYYLKRGSNLVYNGNWNPITGFPYIRNNSGSLRGSGIEINLQTNTINLDDDFSYGAQLLFSHTSNKVTSKNAVRQPASLIVEQGRPVPLEGYSADALFAYRAAKLDAVTGEPRGYLNDTISKKYTEIRNSQDEFTITYVGSAVPRYVFHFSHRFCYKKHLALSFLVTGRLGYVTYVKGLNYFTLFNDLDGGTADYNRRWKAPGDEEHTTVPALLFPLNRDRDMVYAYNETNYARADNIRLQNLQISYYWDNIKLIGMCKRLDLSISLNNVGFLYKANRRGIDPDVLPGNYPNPRSITFSLNAQF